ncbi:hypothetical protein [Paenibacillus jiagnxiensis]|uniref:hypothetical protein n=1 Tax=Paenibacillus jiagnxiensis TaxID=3228926 RepID=UPI0033B8FD0A
MPKNLDTGGTREKYRIIHSATEQYPVTELCSLLGVSRNGYSRDLRRQGQYKDRETKERIQVAYE